MSMSTEKNTAKCVLTIAGSDPSGGAGIQADLKTFTAIGVYGGAVITCLTLQNTRGVFGIQPVEPDLVKKQIEYVLADLNISHIKIGMLGSAAVAESISEALDDFTGEIFYDPVLVSSSGRELIEPGGHDTIRDRLLPLCTVLTPNLPELSVLTETDCPTRNAIIGSAATLFTRGKRLRAVLVTGGHHEPGKETVTDFMIHLAPDHGTKVVELSHARIKSANTHGTGCTFSAAFTAYHSITGNDAEAFRCTVNYMDQLIRKSDSAKIGNGTGPLLHHLK